MLAAKTYNKQYIDQSRQKIKSDITAFDSVDSDAAFERSYFNNLVVVLEMMFVHRTRAIEGKDGNPLNEVRVLATSLLSHGGAFTPEKSIKISADRSVLGHNVGDEIKLGRSDFEKLSEAFFAELEAKFLD